MKTRFMLGWFAAILMVACGGADDELEPSGGGGDGAGGTTSAGGTGSGGDAAAGGGSAGSGGTGAAGGGGAGPCGAVSTFETGQTPTVELHVDEGGSDASGDGSSGNPFATIDHAVGQASPGTAIVVHSGTYAGGINIEGLSGSADAPIWIGGAPGEDRPVLQGGPNGIRLSRVRHLVVHDLEIRDADFNGINCDDGSEFANPDATRFVVFRGLAIHDIGSDGNQDCLKLSGVDDFWVLSSEFARCGGAMASSGIDHVGCHQGLVAYNRFEQMSGNAVQTKGGSTDITIEANHFVDCGQRAVNIGGSTDFNYFRPPLSTTEPNAEARNIQVMANVIERGESALAFVGCVDCVAANNTIVDPQHWVMRILQETTSAGGYAFLPASNGRVVNNLVYYRAADIGVHVNVGPDTDPQSFVFQTNLWFAHDAPGNSAPNLPVSEQGGIVGQDPSLLDPANGAFDLLPGSPAVGAGTSADGLGGDFVGACFNEPPSIGALELAADGG